MSVTDAVLSEVTAWQSQPLEPMYPVIFFDALRVKIASFTHVPYKGGNDILAALLLG